MTIKNPYIKSKEEFLSAFLCHVRSDTQIKDIVGNLIPHGSVQDRGVFYGSISHESIRVVQLRRFMSLWPQRYFTGNVEETAEGVVIRGRFRFPWKEKLAYSIALFILSWMIDRRILPAAIFGIVGCAIVYCILWVTSLSCEWDVQNFLSGLGNGTD